MNKNICYATTIGGARLMMHNEQLANPFNEYAQALSKLTHKKGKSLDDHKEIARVEFHGGLYFDDKAGPYVPGHCLMKMLVMGARRRKLGKQFEQMVQIGGAVNPLIYVGPRTREGLWEAGTFVDQRLVGVNTARTLRTRPLFLDWSVSFQIVVLDGAVNGSDVQAALEAAESIGLLDGRPTYAGQFVLRSFAEAALGANGAPKKRSTRTPEIEA
jgi:hypothetical protein